MSKIAAAPRQSRAPSSPDMVVGAINDGIMRQRYSIGQRLVESDLTRDLKVSRGTVREALKKLSAEGVVQLSPHRGAFIRALSRSDAEALLLVLEVLCCLAARLAATSIAKNNHRKRFNTAMQSILAYQHSVEFSGFMEGRARFYQTMISIGGNAELERIMPLTHIHLFRTQFHGLWSKKHLREVFREYQEIANAILDGNAKLAESRMGKHIRNTGERMATLPDSAFAPEDAF